MSEVMSSAAAAPAVASSGTPCASSVSGTPDIDEHSSNAGEFFNNGVEHSHCTSPSHRRQRKLWSEEEMRTFWHKKKLEKKMRKKALAADRQKAQQAEWEHLSDEEKAARRAEAALLHERRRQAEAALLSRCEAHLADPHVPAIVFDLSFAWCMTVANTKSTVSQVKFSYSALRTAGFPFRPVITSLMAKEASDTDHDATAQAAALQPLDGFEGFRRFPPTVTQTQHWSELFPRDQVVFLTADSPHILTSIEPDTAYIVGAFVDHNAHKGLSYASAQRHGVRTARLPIKESVELGNRCKVLTINHVVEVLIQYEQLRAAGTPDWAQAIDKALPTRRTQQVMKARQKRQRLGVMSSAGDTDGDDSSAAVEESF
ncbi:hypothetical protein JKF63_03098 [Porcisia hertigi]|uniref:tRNA (guanine(9)-N(1))-methyltransferase n=1 Tax=Porcisia hertigi TaxID=2761500 RepID=A0A836HTF0_9TRYP|nr:hypothetical protein JKF63_03098 [Porcisia hertigi]